MMSATITIHGISIVRSRRLFFSTSSSYHHRPRPRHPHPTTKDGGRNNNNNNNNNNKNNRNGGGSNDKDLFTPSPFKHGSCNININEDYSVVRCLLDSSNNTKKDDVYGMRRYLLLPRKGSSSSSAASSSNYSSAEEVAILEKEAIASINANANVLFGARLHHHHQKNNTPPSSNIIDELYSDNNDNDDDDDDDELYYNSQYSLACGTLLDIAKEDASINGQQVQALAGLDGLCHWVRRCLSNNGEGSAVLTGLIHGYTYVDDDNCGATTSLEEQAFGNNNNSLNKSATTTTTTTTTATTSSLRRGKKRSVSIMVSSSLEKSDEKRRQKILEAITAIATGKPRKGHSIIGAGTYRDGMIGWMALSREYALLSSSSSSSNVALTTAAIDYMADDDYTKTTANPTFSSEEVKGGSREISLYKSRNGEVTKIEHLACTTPEYLIEAGGAMARIFFV